MPGIQLCLFAAEPDIAGLGFIVKVLMGTLEELAGRAVAWTFDGIEFMPNPDAVPKGRDMARALQAAGAVMPVVNSGRMAVQGYALVHQDLGVRRRSVEAYKRLLDFAGHFGARVGLGIARGPGLPGVRTKERDEIAAEVFGDLSAHAAACGAVIMLEPADPGVTTFVNSVEEAMAWVDRIASPAFSKHGIRAARGQARHIHLYDPSRWPPGVRDQGSRLDWPAIMRLLGEERFEGSGSVVVAPEGDAERAARQSAAFLRKLIDEAA